MPNPFTDHPSAVGESYLIHMLVAGRFAMLCLGAGLACLVHAVLPFVFTGTASSIVRRLVGDMSDRGRSKQQRRLDI